jgi:hypothetical protein
MPAECESFEDCVEGRCVGSGVADADCPANFGCVAEGTGKTCLRKSCDTDADCAATACFTNARCSARV